MQSLDNILAAVREYYEEDENMTSDELYEQLRNDFEDEIFLLRSNEVYVMIVNKSGEELYNVCTGI